MFFRSAAVAAVFALPQMTSAAATADEAALMDAMRVGDIVAVMREEGLDYARTLGDDMLPDGSGDSWMATAERLYDTGRMEARVRQGFAAALPDAQAEPLLEFYRSDLGETAVRLEIEAREAMVDPDVEDAAREAYRALSAETDPRVAQIDAFVEANDLVEINVTGALNATYQFYSGLAEAGVMDMSEDEMLTDVWSQEEAVRADTGEWVHAFLLLAYGPLSDDELDRYIALSESDAGAALNTALFAGFNAMYDDLSYAMGLAIGEALTGTDL